MKLRIKKYFGVYEIILTIGKKVIFRQELVMDTDGEYIVDMKSSLTDKQYFPQKRANKTMGGKKLLEKAMKGKQAFKTEKQIKEAEIKEILTKHD